MACKFFFSNPIGLSFHFADYFFAVQKLFSLINSHLLILNFVACALGVISKKIIRSQTHVKEIYFSYHYCYC